MGADAGSRAEWRHLLPIPGLDEDRVDASSPLKVVVAVGPGLADRQAVQHLTWLLVTLLTRSTKWVVAAVGISSDDAPLRDGVDPGHPDGGLSLLDALKATADAFGPEAAPVVDADELPGADLVLQIGGPAARAWPDAEVLHVSAAGWTGAVTPAAAGVPPLGMVGENPFGPYVAACLAACQVYLQARVRDYRIQAVVLNAWTLTESTAGPGEPGAELDHVLAGVGAVGTALLFTLWAYPEVSGTIRAADADIDGIDDTNLSRCVPFRWTDLHRPKAVVAADRLSGRHGLVIEGIFGTAENLVEPRSHLISAVDTPEARQALQDKYPASAVQAATSGLRLEMLRVDPTTGTACLRCFNPPRAVTPDSEIRARIANMDENVVAAHAAAVGADPDQVREWGRAGGCGRIGGALLDRLRPSDGRDAQFSVGFMSVLAGVLLAAQVLKDAVARAGDPERITVSVPLAGENARFVTNLLAPASALAGVRRYSRDGECPACQGIRAEVWANRWTG
ncbi:ThiF family adenylyltransferase [Amycolatopsis sp. NPDC051903]|uniref:ThiF family adenylyltransferase n=1 Tax=Amycolatopsis sp. NPDC051903 TaxID=3363936 RepID=UPI0037A09560